MTAIDVKRVTGTDDKVDVTIRVDEQNRNQLQFGAGMSQYEGFFGSASFTEPFAFNRAMSMGSTVYSRKVDYAMTSATTDYSAPVMARTNRNRHA